MMDTRFWLVATVGFTACLWMPYVLDRFVRIGIARTLGNPSPEHSDALSAWARRAQRAHANAVENLAVFAPLAILAIERRCDASLACGAAATYFVARVVHPIVYAAGLPVLRTLAFLVGFGAQIALAIAAFGGAP